MYDVHATLATLNGILLSIGQDAFVFLIILGVILHFSRLSRKMGRDFLARGIILSIFIAIGAPYLMASTSC